MPIEHRVAIVAITLLVCTHTSFAGFYNEDTHRPKPIYDVAKWPGDLAAIPCAAWRKDTIGGWTLTGTINWTNGDLQVVRPSYQLDTPEGIVIEKTCAGRRADEAKP